MNKMKSIVLPEDNKGHDFIVEWWYFNGFVNDKKGKLYSFMDCFFKVNLNKVGIPHIIPHLIEKHLKNGKYIHFSHSVVSDISKRKSYKEIQNISLVSKDSFKKKFLYINYKDPLVLNGLSNSEIIEVDANNFYIKTKNLNLNLISNKKPLLEGGHGYVGVPEVGSYYYSLTDLSVKGNLNINGKEIEVEGKGWMDHQWANTVYKKDTWTWFSIQLENNFEIMCVNYEKGGGKGIGMIFDLIDDKGKQIQYKKIKMIPNKIFWKSKKTKTIFPLSWKIIIDKAKIEINISALIKDQEMIFGQINYWEGPIRVEAKINDKKIKGKGFMELVGYRSDYNYFSVLGKEIEKSIIKKTKRIFRKN